MVMDPLYLWRNSQTGFRRWLSLRKIRNALLAKYEQKRNQLCPRAFPFTAIIDPANICQLSCPLCPTGQKVEGRKPGVMKLHTADRIIEEIGDYLIDVELDNWGEPFLNPDIYEIISRFSGKRIQTSISTNLSFEKQFDPQEIIKCGLDHLIVSIDGATEKTYQKYRVGGNFELVLSNLRKLVEDKKRLSSAKPFLTMKFLVFPHNLNEQEAFQKLAKEIGADRVWFKSPYFVRTLIDRLYPKMSPEQLSQFANPVVKRKNCHWLWTSVAFSWDGAVSPCCFGISYHPRWDFGNILHQSFREIWLSQVYQESRAVFLGQKPKDDRAKFCELCTHRGG